MPSPPRNINIGNTLATRPPPPARLSTTPVHNESCLLTKHLSVYLWQKAHFSKLFKCSLCSDIHVFFLDVFIIDLLKKSSCLYYRCKRVKEQVYSPAPLWISPHASSSHAAYVLHTSCSYITNMVLNICWMSRSPRRPTSWKAWSRVDTGR